MNMKSLASIGLASLLAVSACYAAPAAADDPANNFAGAEQMASASTDNAMDQSDSASPSAGNDAAAPSSGTGDNSGASSSDNSGMGSADQGSPDTATGDDDY